MAATKGNEWWRLRATHGRDKIWETPELLWEAACEYFEATDKRKWEEKDWVGKNAREVTKETETPYTLTGLCLFLRCDTDTFRNYCEREEWQDFFEVAHTIRDIIYTQKFEGAAVGAFNANIIARDLGLKDKQESDVKGGLNITGDIEITYK